MTRTGPGELDINLKIYIGEVEIIIDDLANILDLMSGDPVYPAMEECMSASSVRAFHDRLLAISTSYDHRGVKRSHACMEGVSTSYV